MQRAVLALLALASLILLASLLVGGEGAAVLFGAVAMAFPVLLCALGALHRGRLSWPLLALLAALLFCLEGSYLGMLLLRGRVADGPWLAGLPAAALLLLGGIWLLPLLFVSLGYAWTFEGGEAEPEGETGREEG